MQKALLYKCLLIGGLMLVLLIILSRIGGVVNERKFYRFNVIKEIAQSGTAPQLVTGAMLVVPYKETITVNTEVYRYGGKETVPETTTVQKYKYFLPETLMVDGKMTTEERSRGIYKIPVYQTKLALRGNFTVPQSIGLKDNLLNVSWGEPYIILGIQDVRGIQSVERFTINHEEVAPLSGTQTTLISQGIHAPFTLTFDQEQNVTFDIALELQGMSQLSFRPTGKSTKVSLVSTWPHPSFTGNFLPKTREVSNDGFSAEWETSFFSSNIPEHLENCTGHNNCVGFEQSVFGVSLYEGVDIYLQTERSIKYALLFVSLTFAVFFLFEILKNLRIHMVQYGLVGLALALFYLLLVSLSEHIAFAASYLIASTACVTLLGFYVSFVLHSIVRGTVFSSMLAGLYGALYLLINSEDYSMLMGSGLLFSLLALIMVITRRVNWYGIESGVKEQWPGQRRSGKVEAQETETN